VTIASVTVPGRRAVPESVLRAAMSDNKKGINKVGGIYDEDGMNVAELYVSAAYWDRGFANVHVGSHRVVRKGKRLVVELPIVEGPTFRIGRIATPGIRSPKLPVKRGDLFSRTKISDARELLEKALDVPVYPTTAFDLEHHTIDITFKPEWRWPWDEFARWPSLLR
jgi:outer membrane protein assembly factor BamA